jgi:hypothetical protein
MKEKNHLHSWSYKEKMATWRPETRSEKRLPAGEQQEKDKELKEILEELNRMMLKMQQEVRGSWRYEWPLKLKVRWLLSNKLVSRRQWQVLRRWLRHAENLSATKEEMVCVCEAEVGRNLSDEEERSAEDLIDFQEGRDECRFPRREMRWDQSRIS